MLNLLLIQGKHIIIKLYKASTQKVQPLVLQQQDIFSGSTQKLESAYTYRSYTYVMQLFNIIGQQSTKSLVTCCFTLQFNDTWNDFMQVVDIFYTFSWSHSQPERFDSFFQLGQSVRFDLGSQEFL